MRYKSSKEYIVSNTLSRLISVSKAELLNNYSKLNYLFTTLFIRINDLFYDRLVKGYEKDFI